METTESAGDEKRRWPHEGLLRPLLMARNASGLRELARQKEIGDEELADFVRTVVAEEVAGGLEDRIGERYDIHTGEYTTLEEWTEKFLGSLG